MQVFKALQLAVASGNAKLSDSALGALHKLVSHSKLWHDGIASGEWLF